MAETFPQLKKVLGGIVDRPMASKLADLSKLSNRHRSNPGYPLVAAMVASIARHNHLDAAKNLQKAGRLLKQGRNAELARHSLGGRPRARLSAADRTESLELAFATHMHRVVELEFAALREPRLLRGRFRVRDVQARAARVEETRNCLAALGKVASAFSDSTFAATMHAGVSALAQAHPVQGRRYKASVSKLEQLTKRGDCRDLARFFLVYAYRRARSYDKALKTARGMERRHPNSSMLQQMIGSCYGFAGDNARSLASYKKAVALGRRDPATHLGLAIAAQRAGDLRLAAAEQQRARSLDRKGQLKVQLDSVGQDQKVLERMPSRLF